MSACAAMKMFLIGWVLTLSNLDGFPLSFKLINQMS